MKNPGHIRNKAKRTQVYAKYKQEKKKQKKILKEERIREVEALGEAAPPKQQSITIDNARLPDQTTVIANDPEVLGDEADDEFAHIYNPRPAFVAETTEADNNDGHDDDDDDEDGDENEDDEDEEGGEEQQKQSQLLSSSSSLVSAPQLPNRPKILITTRPKCSHKLFPFIGDLMQMIPNAFYYPRDTHLVKDICKYASNKLFSHVIILSEKAKVCDGLLLINLPHGPTSFFRLSNYQAGETIPNHGKPTSHIPELILNNFGTRLGRRIGRFLGSLFPQEPDMEGRQVVTFHNQRDFIFVRHHRYVYRQEGGQGGKVRARLQELGPRFTLKLKWLMNGTFDTEFGEYEWIHNRKEMDGNRRKFNL